MASQRKLRRIQLITALQVFDPASSQLLGVVNDITVEGVGVRVREKMQVQQHYALRLALPAAINGASLLDVRGRCAWAGVSSNPDLFDVGFQFVDLAPDAVEVIEELIRRYQR
ncbi:MAG: PilZ domain-containing protein [Lentisphaerae bacterium]|nr:PilZ domain-containing protein [Lentisphaerota bacterium]